MDTCSTTLGWFPHSLHRSSPPYHLHYWQRRNPFSTGNRYENDQIPGWLRARSTLAAWIVDLGCCFVLAFMLFVSWKALWLCKHWILWSQNGVCSWRMLDFFGFNFLWYRWPCTSWAFLLMPYLMLFGCSSSPIASMLMIPRSYPIEAYSVSFTVTWKMPENDRKCAILILHDLNMFSRRARIDLSFSLHREGTLHGVVFPEGLWRWQSMRLQPQHHNQQWRLPKRIKTSRHFTLWEQPRSTFLASQETHYIEISGYDITCILGELACEEPSSSP